MAQLYLAGYSCLYWAESEAEAIALADAQDAANPAEAAIMGEWIPRVEGARALTEDEVAEATSNEMVAVSAVVDGEAVFVNTDGSPEEYPYSFFD